MTNFIEAEAAEKRRKEREEHSVEAYETKFKEIEQITGEQDLDKLVERFIQGIFICSHRKLKFKNLILF